MLKTIRKCCQWLSKPGGGQSQAAMSLVESMMALGIVSLSGAAILKVVSTHNQQVSSAKSLPTLYRAAQQAQANAARLFTDVRNPITGLKDQAVCRWIEPASYNPGVSKISVLLPADTADTNGKSPGIKQAFTDADWRSKFAGWAMVTTPNAECNPLETTYKRCFTIAADNNMGMTSQEIARYDIMVAVQVKPKYVNPVLGFLDDIPLASRELTSKQVSDVGFEINTTLYYNRPTKDGVSRGHRTFAQFMWLPSVASCFKNNTVLSLSGLGASDPKGQTVYNVPDFNRIEGSPLELYFQATQVQEGQQPTNTSIRSKVSANIVASCNEKRYQCPNDPAGASQRSYSQMDIYLKGFYQPRNRVVGFATQMTMTPDIAFLRGRTDAFDYGRATKTFAVDLNTTADGRFQISNTHEISARISDPGDESAANNICRTICREPSNFNRSGNDTANFQTRFLHSYQDNTGETQTFSQDSGQAVGCTACYMHNCSQIGLATFGPMTNQPQHPLDVGIPYCYKHERTDGGYFTSGPHYRNARDVRSRCVAARFSRDGSSLELEERNCNDKLPVMCFGFGRFLLAESMNRNGTKELVYAKGSDNRNNNNPQTDREDACFNLAKEYADRNKVNTLLNNNYQGLPEASGRPWQDIPSEGNDYSFVNLPYQGLFIAPQTPEDVKNAFQKMELDPRHRQATFWVNLKYVGRESREDRDAGVNVLVAGPLYMPQAASERHNRHALAYDDRGFLRYLRFASTEEGLTLFDHHERWQEGEEIKPADRAYLLFNHFRYRGLRLSQGNKDIALRVLCMDRRGQMQLAPERAKNASQAHQACRQERLYFAQPQTPKQWLDALLLTAELDDGVAYPKPVFTSRQLDPTWVSQYYNADLNEEPAEEAAAPGGGGGGGGGGG